MRHSARPPISLRALVVVTLLLPAIVLLFSAASAWAAPPGPGWAIRAVAQPTNLSSTHDAACEHSLEHGGTLEVCDSYVLIVTNVGSQPTNAGVAGSRSPIRCRRSARS